MSSFFSQIIPPILGITVQIIDNKCICLCNEKKILSIIYYITEEDPEIYVYNYNNQITAVFIENSILNAKKFIKNEFIILAN